MTNECSNRITIETVIEDLKQFDPFIQGLVELPELNINEHCGANKDNRVGTFSLGRWVFMFCENAVGSVSSTLYLFDKDYRNILMKIEGQHPDPELRVTDCGHELNIGYSTINSAFFMEMM